SDRAIHNVDRFRVYRVEEVLVHVFTDDADAQPFEVSGVSEALVRFVRLSIPAEYRQRILRIVAGNDVENFRSIFHSFADRADPGVEAHAHHSFTADKFLSGRQADSVVGASRTTDRGTRLFTDGAGHQIGSHGRAGA